MVVISDYHPITAAEIVVISDYHPITAAEIVVIFALGIPRAPSDNFRNWNIGYPIDLSFFLD
jgi:hypothetical protein